MKRKLLIIGVTLLSGLSFSQTQIGNGDMELWEPVAGESEPVNWNSFLTASGSQNGFADNQIEQSTDTRPGSSGSSSCRIFSRGIFFNTIIANGNVTLGRINMGSTTASNQENHNYTIPGDADFSEEMTDMPDSLVLWVKFNADGASEEARVKAIIHDDYAYEDPEDAASSSHVVAVAITEFTSTSGWVRLSMPFDYSGPASTPAYILMTATTNKVPGGGDADDEMFIDDVELIYNPAIDNDGDGVIEADEIADGTSDSDPCDFVLASVTGTPSTAWNSADCDGDGMDNGTEVTNGTDPLVDEDHDGDGVLGSVEIADGTSDSDFCDFVLASATVAPSAAWNAADCDNDQVSNGQELIDGTDPLVSDLVTDVDSDGDGVLASAETTDGTSDSDPCDFVLASATETPSSAWDAADCDGDGVSNGQEVIDGTDPLTHNSASISELANDGIKVSYLNGEIKIMSTANFEGNYVIYNTVGKEIQKGKVSPSIEFTSTTGLYFVKMANSSKTYSFEILVD